MYRPEGTLRIRQKSAVDRETDAFLPERRARRLAPGTIGFCAQKLAHLRAYVRARGIELVEEIAPRVLLSLLLDFTSGHNPGLPVAHDQRVPPFHHIGAAW